MAVFELSEYKERISKTKKRMRESGIDVLLVTNPANMNYLTGYDGWSFYVHQGVFVSMDQADPIWFGRGMDANGAKLTTWMEPTNIRAYNDDYVQSPVKHPMQYAAGIIRETPTAIRMSCSPTRTRSSSSRTSSLPRGWRSVH